MWAFGAWLSGRRPPALWGLLAGLALGQVLMVRIDMLFLVALPILTAGWLWLRRRAPEKGPGSAGRPQEGVLWFFLSAALLTAHMALHTGQHALSLEDSQSFALDGFAEGEAKDRPVVLLDESSRKDVKAVKDPDDKDYMAELERRFAEDE